MTRRTLAHLASTAALAVTTAAVPPLHAGTATLSLASGQVTIEGSSNLHPYTASTTAVRLTKVIAAAPAGALLDQVLQPGGIEAFDLVITASSLKSPKDAIDKNMHKALKAEEHREIAFSLRTLEPAGDKLRAAGTLTIAGVQRDVLLDLQAQRSGDCLTVTGATDILMTDYGITPPKAMLGMLKTDPKVRVRFELVLAGPQT